MRLLKDKARRYQLVYRPCLLLTSLLVLVGTIGSSSFASQNSAGTQDPPKKSTTPDSPEQLKANIKRLTSEVDRLRRKVANLEKTCEITSLRDRLTKEELRGEDLQSQLVSVGEREASLQARMDEVNEQLRPENLARLQVFGSTRPEQVRESTRTRLTNERQRLQTQLDQLAQSKTRLQNSLNVSDMVVQKLRLQLQNAARP